jgi:hypothetical protein
MPVKIRGKKKAISHVRTLKENAAGRIDPAAFAFERAHSVHSK